jgi:hypothetical protein
MHTYSDGARVGGSVEIQTQSNNRNAVLTID